MDLESSSTATPLSLHVPSGAFSATVLKLHLKPSDTVSKTHPILSYAYNVFNKREGTTEQLVTVWESPVEGTVVRFTVREGDAVPSGDEPIVYIEEPCKHDVQLHGLCALCGKDLTTVDYTGFSDTSRADISMAHDSGGLRVSLEEAHRLEALTTRRLREAKKLSLIVDLDQTIIHATVDPTVGEWLEDETNPNWGALEGTKKFKLGENTEAGESEGEGCWYYVKQRPGLKTFLSEISKLYEMHIYTMGTRAYASEVCKIIDPDGALFGGRILSRDESGSLTRKSLRRLFPCDQSMVVVIDDRADVWDGSPNLVKVVPYDFFVGIGDINAGFLPKTKELSGSAGPDETVTVTSELSPPSETTESVVGEHKEQDKPEVNGDSASDSIIISPSLVEGEASVAITIHEQIENRPLSKTKAATEEEDQEVQEVAVLKDDDDELTRVFSILKTVRDIFFDEDSTMADVRAIIPTLKRKVLEGCHIVFSGVVALGTKPEESEHWRLATLFGATCSADLTDSTTHVVANQNGTIKVHRARRHPGIHIVWTKWLLDSLALWSRQPESMYAIPDITIPVEGPLDFPDPSSEPTSSSDDLPTPTSSTLEDDEDEDEEGEDEEGLDAPPPPPAPLGDTIDIDWAAANDEVDAFLNESDTDNNMDADDGDTTDDNISNNVLVTASSSRLPKQGRLKRPRKSTDFEEDSSSARKETPSTAAQPGSPLQKRVKTSRSRTSKLKVSFPPIDSSDEKEKASTVAGDEGIGRADGPGLGDDDDDDDGDDDDDEDDEALLKMMAAEMEKNWEGT